MAADPAVGGAHSPRAVAPRRGAVAPRRAPTTPTPTTPEPAVPAQLPVDTPIFVGREDQLARLDSRAEHGAAAARVLAIVGGAGVGKTTLAVRWAHRVRRQFPDGQLFLNLRGHAPGSALSPVDALTRLLTALDVAAERIPADVDAAAAVYRTRLAEERVLVVLDDALDAEQVRPLLPGGTGCLTLVTSRHQLDGLAARDGAVRIPLDVLSPSESAALLTSVLGAGRVGREPAAAARLGDICAHLPLALRIAAAHLEGRPEHDIAAYVATLSTGDRLAQLEAPGDERTAVRVAFASSYECLSPDARRLFGLLGAAPGSNVTAEEAAVLTAGTADAAHRLLTELRSYHLISEVGPGRFGFHDLLRAYAAQCAPPDSAAALDRIYGHYLRGANAAAWALYPTMLRLDLPDDRPAVLMTAPEAVAWLGASLPNLVAAVLHAAARGPDPMAWTLADCLRGYFTSGQGAADWPRVAEAALASAVAAGARRPEAMAALSLGQCLTYRGRRDEAAPYLDRAMRLCRLEQWDEGQSACLASLAHLALLSNQPQQAVRHLGDGLVINRRLGRRAAEAKQLANLGAVYIELGRLADARRCLTQAHAFHVEAGHRADEAACLNNLADICLRLSEPDQAAEYAERSVAISRELDMLEAASSAHARLARADRDRGRVETATRHANEALTIATRSGDPRVLAQALAVLGSLDAEVGELDRAQERYTESLLHRTAHASARIEALTGLAAIARARAELSRALEYAESALAIAEECAFQPGLGEALVALAAAQLEAGEVTKAEATARRALDASRRSGFPAGVAPARAILRDPRLGQVKR